MKDRSIPIYCPLWGIFISLVVLSVFTLPSASAAGVTIGATPYATIQLAIDAVVCGNQPDGSVINVTAGTYTENLRFYICPGRPPKSVKIVGAGAATTIIKNTQATNGSVLTIYDLTTNRIYFNGFTFQNGLSNGGGGAYIRNASPVFENCIFANNSAYKAASGGGDGGGVFITSDNNWAFPTQPVFSGCTFAGNKAERFGGGMFINRGSTAQLSPTPYFLNCTILSNYSGVNQSLAQTDGRGAGGAAHIAYASAFFHNCLLEGNNSFFSGGAIHIIGGYNAGENAILELHDCAVRNNLSRQGAGEPFPSEGGGIHIEDNTIARLYRCQIANNTAGTGGGLNNYRARYEIVSSIIENNNANNSSSPIGGLGGAINCSSTNMAAPARPAGEIYLNDTVIRNNTAVQFGGGIYAGGDFNAPQPSANKAIVKLTQCLLDNNRAGKTGYGINACRSIVTVQDSHITRNAPTVYAVPVPDPNNPQNGYGGGLSLEDGSQGIITNTTFAFNKANTYGSAIWQNGGGSLTVNSSCFYGNSTPDAAADINTWNGGGAVTLVSVSTSFSTCQITDNTPRQIQFWDQSGAVTVAFTNNNIKAPGGPAPKNSLWHRITASPYDLTNINDVNAIPGNSGNYTINASYLNFKATPRFLRDAAAGNTVAASVLSWVFPGTASILIDGTPYPDPSARCFTVDKNPTGLTTTYTASGDGYNPSVVVYRLVPVHRFWSQSYTSHHYTTNESERNMILTTWPDYWTYEGMSFFAYPNQQPATLPVYRFWSQYYTSHHYTIDEAEKNFILANWGAYWTYEGTAFYAYPTPQPDTLPVYRFWSPWYTSHHYTISEWEKSYILANWGAYWTYEGVAFYAYPALIANPY